MVYALISRDCFATEAWFDAAFPGAADFAFDIPFRPVSSITIDTSHADNGDTTRAFSADFARDGGEHILLNAQTTTTAVLRDDISINDWQLGFSNDVLSDYTFAMSYAQSNAADSLSIHTLQLQFGINLAAHWLTLAPQTRSIRMYLQGGLPGAPDFVDLDSHGYAASWNYFAVSDWRFSLRYQANNYSRNVSALDSVPRLIYLFTPSALSLASSFTEREWSADSSFNATPGVFALNWQQARSAIDQGITTTVRVQFVRQLDAAFEASLQAGNTATSSAGQRYDFYGIGLTYYW